MHAGTLVIAFAATGMLALGMSGHARLAFASECWRSTAARTLWKTGGWLLVVLTLVLAVRQLGWGAGVAGWLLALASAGLGVTLLLTYRPRILPAVIAAAVLLGGTSLTLSFA